MKLYPLDLTRLHQDEAAAFTQRFGTDYSALNLDSSNELDFNLLLQAMQSKLPTYILAVNQIQAQAESKIIFELDTTRDKKLSTLRTALQVFKNTDNANEKTAFNALKIVFNNYKNVAKENFETESLNLTKMIGELRNATQLPAVQLLGLENHIDAVETANEAFKTTFFARSTNVNMTVVYDAKKLNKEILNSYKKLANYILTMVTVKDAPFYNSVFAMTNNIRQYYADIIARRGAGNSGPTTQA